MFVPLEMFHRHVAKMAQLGILGLYLPSAATDNLHPCLVGRHALDFEDALLAAHLLFLGLLLRQFFATVLPSLICEERLSEVLKEFLVLADYLFALALFDPEFEFFDGFVYD